jgi:hypothetical protein
MFQLQGGFSLIVGWKIVKGSILVTFIIKQWPDDFRT